MMTHGINMAYWNQTSNNNQQPVEPVHNLRLASNLGSESTTSECNASTEHAISNATGSNTSTEQ